MKINKQKKFKISLVFAEGSVKKFQKQTIIKSLPRALAIALGKEFLRKNRKQVFAEGYGQVPRQRILQKK